MNLNPKRPKRGPQRPNPECPKNEPQTSKKNEPRTSDNEFEPQTSKNGPPTYEARMSEKWILNPECPKTLNLKRSKLNLNPECPKRGSQWLKQESQKVEPKCLTTNWIPIAWKGAPNAQSMKKYENEAQTLNVLVNFNIFVPFYPFISYSALHDALEVMWVT